MQYGNKPIRPATTLLYEIHQPDVESIEGKLWNEVALEAFKQLGINNVAENFLHLSEETIANIVELQAKLSFEFADAFMRERYERMCIKATGINLQDLEKK